MKKQFTKESEWYVARNEDGTLKAFNKHPWRERAGEKVMRAGSIGISYQQEKGMWKGGMVSEGWRYLNPDDDWFPEIKWEDEPVKIKRVVTYKRIL